LITEQGASYQLALAWVIDCSGHGELLPGVIARRRLLASLHQVGQEPHGVLYFPQSVHYSSFGRTNKAH